eukprot:scpid84216/ scgid1585/ 
MWMLGFVTLFLLSMFSGTGAVASTAPWTDCRAQHGKILMRAFLVKMNYSEARQHCHTLQGELATVLSTLETICASRAMSEVRNCTCPGGKCTCTPKVSYPQETPCGCSAWVALRGKDIHNGKYESWTWYTPSSNATHPNLTWRSAYPKNAWSSVTFNPQKGGLADVKDIPRPYLCQEYFPPAPINVTVRARMTDGLNLSIHLHPETIISNVSAYCISVSELTTTSMASTRQNQTTEEVCGSSQFVWLSVAKNTIYNVMAFVKTPAGLKSGLSTQFVLGTKPEAPKKPTSVLIASTTITVHIQPIPGGNMPILLYCANGSAFADHYLNSSLISACNVSADVILTSLVPNTTYTISTYISNAYGESDISNFTRFTTLPPG